LVKSTDEILDEAARCLTIVVINFDFIKRTNDEAN